MSRTKTATQRKPPVDGAVQAYWLAPAEEEDAFAWVAENHPSAKRGWEAVEVDYRLGASDGTWIMVELWAIPPRVAGEAL